MFSWFSPYLNDCHFSPFQLLNSGGTQMLVSELYFFSVFLPKLTSSNLNTICKQMTVISQSSLWHPCCISLQLSVPCTPNCSVEKKNWFVAFSDFYGANAANTWQMLNHHCDIGCLEPVVFGSTQPLDISNCVLGISPWTSSRLFKHMIKTQFLSSPFPKPTLPLIFFFILNGTIIYPISHLIFLREILPLFLLTYSLRGCGRGFPNC